jgi:hypothetical protein
MEVPLMFSHQEFPEGLKPMDKSPGLQSPAGFFQSIP